MNYRKCFQGSRLCVAFFIVVVLVTSVLVMFQGYIGSLKLGEDLMDFVDFKPDGDVHDHKSPTRLQSSTNSELFRVAVFDGPIVTVVNATTRQEALVAIQSNLKQIQSQVPIAKGQGAFILVLPEYGITGFIDGREHQRVSVYPYLEKIPKANGRVCDICEPSHDESIIQSTIACLSRKNQIYIVANLIEGVQCDALSDKNCPSDGHYQYNTNIIFDSNGCLIAKYHKFNLYAEEFDRLDHPLQPEHIYFDTKYGRFGTIICQDAIFKEPGVTLVEEFQVDHILFPTAWDDKNDFVYMRAIEWHSAFARRFGVNFLASNIHDYKRSYTGSGIYNGSGIVKYIFNDKDNNGTLAVADIAPHGKALKSNRDHYQIKDVQHLKDEGGLNVIIYNDTYKAVFISQRPGPGSASVCYNGFCCRFNFIRDNSEENYILAAFDGYHSFEGSYYIQSCVVYRCDSSGISSCMKRQTESKTTFTAFSLSATFNTNYVFPTVTPSLMRYESVKWDFTFSSNGSNTLFGKSDWPIIEFNILGRVYEKDNRPKV